MYTVFLCKVLAKCLGSIAEADNYDPLDNDTHGTLQTDLDEAQISKPVRPKEFRSFMVVPFVSLLIALAISLGVLLAKNQPYGKHALAEWSSLINPA